MKKNKSGINILDRLITLVVSYSIAFSVFALAATIVVYGKWLYYLEIDFLNIPDLADMTKDEIKRNYDVLITYLSPFYEGALQLPTLDMSTNGRIHFVDVKNILPSPSPTARSGSRPSWPSRSPCSGSSSVALSSPAGSSARVRRR